MPNVAHGLHAQKQEHIMCEKGGAAHLGAVKADGAKHVQRLGYEPNVEHWLFQLNMPKVARTLSATTTTGQALEVAFHRAHVWVAQTPEHCTRSVVGLPRRHLAHAHVLKGDSHTKRAEVRIRGAVAQCNNTPEHTPKAHSRTDEYIPYIIKHSNYRQHAIGMCARLSTHGPHIRVEAKGTDGGHLDFLGRQNTKLHSLRQPKRCHRVCRERHGGSATSSH